MAPFLTSWERHRNKNSICVFLLHWVKQNVWESETAHIHGYRGINLLTHATSEFVAPLRFSVTRRGVLLFTQQGVSTRKQAEHDM